MTWAVHRLTVQLSSFIVGCVLGLVEAWWADSTLLEDPVIFNLCESCTTIKFLSIFLAATCVSASHWANHCPGTMNCLFGYWNISANLRNHHNYVMFGQYCMVLQNALILENAALQRAWWQANAFLLLVVFFFDKSFSMRHVKDNIQPNYPDSSSRPTSQSKNRKLPQLWGEHIESNKQSEQEEFWKCDDSWSSLEERLLSNISNSSKLSLWVASAFHLIKDREIKQISRV